jgi:hypothetical protein
MASKNEILSELGSVTDKLSSQVRTTAVAVLALTWGLLVGDSPVAQAISSALKPILILLGAASIVVLFFDFLQYVAGYASTRKLLDEIERTGRSEGQYDYRGLAWRSRLFFFWARQVVLVLTVLTMLVVFGRWALSA